MNIIRVLLPVPINFIFNIAYFITIVNCRAIAVRGNLSD